MDISPTSPHLQHADPLHRRWPAELEQLTRIRAALRGWLGHLNLTEDIREDILLAASEAAGNAVEHAYLMATAPRVVQTTFWTGHGRVHIEIVDHGRWKTPSTLPSYRGRGIALMRQLADTVTIHHDDRGTRVRLSHPLRGQPCDRVSADGGLVAGARDERPPGGRPAAESP